MKFTFNFKNLEKQAYIRGMKRLDDVLLKNGKITMIQAGEDVEGYIKLDMAQGAYTGGKAGRTYIKGRNRSISHRASASGQSPALDTGRLIGSVGISHKFQSNKLVVTIGAGGKVIDGVYVDYAKYLENGTRKMAPRPFMKPAMQEERRKFHDRIVKMYNKSIREAFK